MPPPKPDRFARTAWFGFGAVAGAVAGLHAAVGTDWNTGELVGVVAGAALVFGAGAATFGDRFWVTLFRGWGGW